MTTATFIRDVSSLYRGEARLYQTPDDYGFLVVSSMTPEQRGGGNAFNQFVYALAGWNILAGETVVFVCGEDGIATETALSRIEEDSAFEEALEAAGYEVID